MSKFSHIFIGSLGNGLTIADKTKMEHGDYKTIAHISSQRSVTFYGKLPDELKEYIFSIARTDNSNISATQTTKLFGIKPNEKYQFKLDGKVHRVKILSYNRGATKNFLSGSIYTEDAELYELNNKGFKDFAEAQESARKFGYEIWEHNF